MCGKEKKPHIKTEEICDLDLYIWHFYFGLPGMINDDNIMWLSPLMNSIMIGKFPPMNITYNIGNERFTWFYFLADGIYPPNYKIYIQTISPPTAEREKLFSRLQVGIRKCIERVFGVIFKTFGILNIPSRLWCSNNENTNIIKACAIIHNMCVEERRYLFPGDGIGGS